VPSFWPGVAPLATSVSARWIHTGTPAVLRARSAKPVWSLWAWVSSTASRASSPRPSAVRVRSSRFQSPGAGVDQYQLAAVLEQVEVADATGQPVNAVRDFHGMHPPSPR
jgi:hypothetical protein